MALGLIGIVTILGGVGSQARAQDVGSELEAIASFEAQRVVMLDLRLRTDAHPEDYAASAGLFNLLRDLTPTDAGLVRRGIEAAFAGGETALMESLTRELVRLDPADTVAQLRLISMLINRVQTVEERVTMYERFLGPAGARLDASVRSRLALDASLLQRELGNHEGFIGWLVMATELDPTNKDAASFAAQFFTARIDDPMGRLELQVNLLYADPVDPNVHAAISRELLQEGAYEQARRFFLNSVVVAEMLGRDDEGMLVKQLELEFLIDDPGNVVDTLEGIHTELMINAQRRMDYVISMDLPTEGEQDPMAVRLPRYLEFLRLLAADAAGRKTQRKASLEGLTKTIEVEVDELFQLGAAEPDPQRRSELIREMVSRFVQLQIVRLLLGDEALRIEGDQGPDGDSPEDPQITMAEMVENDLENLSGRLDGTDPVRAVLAPWIELSRGNSAEALRLIEELPQTALITLCTGIAESREGNTAAALEHLAAAGRELTNPGLSAWARRLAIEIGGDDAVLTPLGQAMAEFAERVPRWIDRMISNPSSFMLMRVEAGSTRVDSGELAVLRIRIENIAPIPLGFGADRTISSRLLISPMLDLGVEGFEGSGQPEILEIDQRLRLKPGEQVSVEILADPGYTGWLIGSNSHVTMRERWRVMQDFWIGTSGAIEPGAVALSASTDTVRRLASPMVRLSIEELTQRVQSSTLDSLPGVFVVIRTRLMHPDFADEPQAGVDGLIDALIERYAAAESAERVLMLSMLPHGSQSSVMVDFDSAAVEQSGQSIGAELGMVLLTRIRDAESPLLIRATSSENPSVARLALVLQSRLSDGRKTLATVGGGYDELAGLTPSRFVRDGDR